MKLFKYIAFASLAVAFSACDVNNELDEIPEGPSGLEQPNAGGADFSNYVAIGASFTAGVSDGTLFLASQINSFPNMISQRMATMGGGDFNQPLVKDNIGGLTLVGQGVIAGPRLFFNGAGPAVLPGTPTTEVSEILSGPFNNFGIPGAKSFHMVAPGYGNILGVGTTANAYFVRMASSTTATVLGDAAATNPTFFTISEIGGNDVLGYATSGGTGTVQTGNPDPTTYAPNDITDPGLFTQVLNTMIQTLTANGAQGAIATVPSIVNLPFFTAVPYNAVPLDQATADLVNGGYAAYNGGLQAAFQALAGSGLFTQEELDRRTINFAAGNNAVVIIDEDLTDLGAINPAFMGIPKLRQATADDFLVLTSSAFIGTLQGGNPQLINGVTVPLEDRWVLTPEEQAAIQTATDAYNATIVSLGNANNLAVVDLDAILTAAAGSGFEFGDFNTTADLVFGGLVSLDGIHLTSRGYALMASEILKAIDKQYGSNFEASGNLLSPDDFPTNYPPTLK